MTHKIIGVSLGPGDPELITIKGLKALQHADKIYYPGSLFSNGNRLSYSAEILHQLNINKEKCEGFYLKMNADRLQANHMYDQTATRILQDIENGLNVAVVSEGDISTYSSFSYLLDRFQQQHIIVKLIPGITSYALGAASIKHPLGLQNDQIIIIPRIASASMLREALSSTKTVILMKIRTAMKVIEEVLNDVSWFVYCERLGTDKEFITQDWNKVQERNIPYFSLIILQK